jgi:CRISPR-associated protein (TIGR03986 family)
MASNTNYKRPVHTNPKNPNRRARAPYNFVPLPGNIVTAETPPDQDRYTGLTGWFECEMETCSPVYVRGMMTLDQFDKADKKAKELSDEEKLDRAPFYSYKQENGQPVPVIPGSSLRGMLRSLIEIAAYGKMKWVNDSPSITFRAVAASSIDPLSEPYRQVIGQFSREVRAGYLEKTDKGEWLIRPAWTPKEKGWPDQSAFLRVKEKKILTGAISNFYYFDDPEYLPEYFYVSFDAIKSKSRFGGYTEVTRIGDEGIGYEHKGVLVCSGNMLETNRRGHKSPRSTHTLVLPEKPNAKPLKLPDQLIDAYLDSLTPFQQEDLWGKEGNRPAGVLKDGAPVFYVTDKKSGEVFWFGHTPNFRVPAQITPGKVTTPANLIPEHLRDSEDLDLTEAIFGWVERKSSQKDQRAGRVFVTDASFIEAEDQIWYAERPITPATLGSPKVTTFQHYLVQDAAKGHDPDKRQSLAHYIHSTEQTELRGHKLYWHKGANPPISNTAKVAESQLTRISPVRPGVKFRFKVHFESLRPEELGALAWALTLPGEDGQTYRHKLGMGKPLGMGAVAITARLFVTDRKQRYQSLFTGVRLNQAEKEEPVKLYVEKFEQFVLARIAATPQQTKLAEVERIRMLLTMLEWREGGNHWLDQTRYLEIERPDSRSREVKINEYKERPVLPDPLAVVESVRSTLVNPSAGSEKKKPSNQSPVKTTKTEEPQKPVASSDYMIGTVKDFGLGIHQNNGIIEADDSPAQEILFHDSQLAFDPKALSENQRVEFKVRPRGEIREAYDIRILH